MSTMTVCELHVDAGSYGVGVRIAFYLQWFGMIITSWLLEADAINLQFVNAVTTAATSIGLFLNLEKLQPVEIYIVLLLACGTLYFTVPVYLWRLVTCCRPWWDPDRWTRIKMGWLFRVLTYSMYGALLSLHIWFWCAGVHDRRNVETDLSSGTKCEQFGFLFSQVRLDGPGMVAINIIIHFIFLLVGTWISASHMGMCEECFWSRSQKWRTWRYCHAPCWSTSSACYAIQRALANWCCLPRITKNRILSLQHFRTICDLIVASIVTLAIELVISWNKITVANDLNSSAQIIPPALTGAYLLRCVCVWITGPDGDGGDNKIQNRSLPPRKRNLSDRQRRSSYRRRRSRRTSRTSADFMDAYPDFFDLSELTVPTPSASFGGFSAPPASGYYGMPSNYYYAYYGDYVGGEVPPLDDNLGHMSPQPPPPPPAPTPASSHDRSQDSPVGSEGFMRM